jgi:hypothetical protein
MDSISKAVASSGSLALRRTTCDAALVPDTLRGKTAPASILQSIRPSRQQSWHGSTRRETAGRLLDLLVGIPMVTSTRRESHNPTLTSRFSRLDAKAASMHAMMWRP